MAATSALPAVAPAPPVQAAAAPRADAAAGSVDFAGLIGLAVAEAALPMEDAVAEDLADVPDDTADSDAGGEGDGTPPLLNWLFGLMAVNGATTPKPDVAAAASDELAAAITAPGPMPTATVSAGSDAAAPIADPVTRWLHATGASRARDLPVASVPPDGSAQTDGTATSGMPVDPALALQDLPSLNEPSASESPGIEVATTELSRDVPVVHAAEARSMDAAASSSLMTAPQHRLPTVATDAPAAPFAGGVLNALSEDFAADLGEHIEWQLGDGISEAKIELHPAELGALTVRIETQGDQARVHIVAAEAATRSLLTQALPQLRELLAGSGMNLARSQVESGGRRDDRSDERNPQQAATPGVRRRATRVLLVDAYA